MASLNGPGYVGRNTLNAGTLNPKSQNSNEPKSTLGNYSGSTLY